MLTLWSLLTLARLATAAEPTPTADAAPNGLTIQGSPDFAVPGSGVIVLLNAGDEVVRVRGIDLVGPLGSADPLPTRTRVRPGEALRLTMTWDEPTGLQPQLLVRTTDGTVILPTRSAPVVTTLKAGEAVPLTGVGGLIGNAAALTPSPTGIELRSASPLGTGDPIILGALDKGLIDGVIKARMDEIRYCYQRALTMDPHLAGKVTVKFVIGKTGEVVSAQVKQTTMPRGDVEGCVAERFLHMDFEAPKGGGIVIVAYPFLFSPA